ALLAIPTVVSFDLRNDSLEGHLFARVLLALARAGWHQNLDLLAFASVKDQVLGGIRQFAKRRLQAESVMLGQTVEPTPAPGVFVMIKGLLHNGAVAQTAARVGHKERGMHALGGSQASASAARAGRVVEGKVAVVQGGGNQMMLGAAKIFPELFQLSAGKP